MDLRCRILRAQSPGELEEQVNRFLGELDEEHEAEVTDIRQSEGPEGITITLWYTLLDEQEGRLPPEGPLADDEEDDAEESEWTRMERSERVNER